MLVTDFLLPLLSLSSVKEVLEYADDMALDIPMIWKYLGEIIGATFRDNSLSLKVLADTMEPVKAARKAGDLMAEILHTVVNFNVSGTSNFIQCIPYCGEGRSGPLK